MAKFQKQRHGHINPVINQEEISLLAAVDRSQSSTSNSQILGRNGEKGIVNFLNRYLPNCFRTVSGHFVTPSGKLSSQIDILILDSRYPLLSENEDGSVIAMLHSVLAAVEVKLSIDKREILKIRKNSKMIEELSAEVFDQKKSNQAIVQPSFAYRTKNKMRTIAKHFFSGSQPQHPAAELTVLRIHDSDQFGNEGPLGAHFAREVDKTPLPLIFTTLAPLSDFYYRILIDMYYSLYYRNYNFHNLSLHTMKYMNWGTFPCLNRGKL